ncbi:MAG: TAXI family TRAP transporter solute-binding subunit [Thermodesulfobacteriota bacterium]|nr:TAXI family TRAP transporter solute-binding subunit [Thermodesulfobacteriota bacterium]
MKIHYFLLTMVIVLMGAFSAQAVTQLHMGTASVGGTFHSAGLAVAQCLNKFLPEVNVTAEITAGTIENLRLLDDRKIQLAVVTPQVAFQALKGDPPWKKKIEFSILTRLIPNSNSYVVLSGSGIKSLSDLKGKRVNVGPAGGGLEPNAKAILEAYGLTYKDFTPLFLGIGAGADALKDKKVDAAITTIPIIHELQATAKIDILFMEEKVIDAMIAKHPYYGKQRVPANTFKEVPQEVVVPDFGMQLAVRSDADPELVYRLTKTLMENVKSLGEAYGPMKMITPDWAATKLANPYHPGAIKYFKEKKVWND